MLHARAERRFSVRPATVFCVFFSALWILTPSSGPRYQEMGLRYEVKSGIQAHRTGVGDKYPACWTGQYATVSAFFDG